MERRALTASSARRRRAASRAAWTPCVCRVAAAGKGTAAHGPAARSRGARCCALVVRCSATTRASPTMASTAERINAAQCSQSLVRRVPRQDVLLATSAWRRASRSRAKAGPASSPATVPAGSSAARTCAGAGSRQGSSAMTPARAPKVRSVRVGCVALKPSSVQIRRDLARVRAVASGRGVSAEKDCCDRFGYSNAQTGREDTKGRALSDSAFVFVRN